MNQNYMKPELLKQLLLLLVLLLVLLFFPCCICSVTGHAARQYAFIIQEYEGVADVK